MTPAMVFRQAADHIEQPGGWTQGVFARDKDGDEVGAESTRAVCRCAAGALQLVCGGNLIDCDMATSVLARAIYARAAVEYSDDYGPALDTVAYWNDAEGRTQAEVVAMLRKLAKVAA